MTSQESMEWIVHGLNNQRFRDYLGPLSRYRKTTELLQDLKAGAKYLTTSSANKRSHFESNVKSDASRNTVDSGKTHNVDSVF